ncbi:MAG: hypothetical protein DRH51_05900 [Candidatus Coatesbacteria bacterium]|nr:MAG: hypothetical protein DRH51_05900 [Candidatus Coatesbacteria bacterium]
MTIGTLSAGEICIISSEKMGDIKKVLSLKKLPPRTITPTKFWMDLCENVHLHLRNYRLDMSVREFKQFINFILKVYPKIYEVIEKNNYKEGNYDFHALFSTKQVINPDSDYYPDRLSIELQRSRNVHIHYRDLRLDISEAEFVELASAFSSALETYKEFLKTKIELPAGEQEVDIDLIQPYDEGHPPLAEDKEHREGIEKLKELIKQGKKIRPILIRPDGQRLDGYKRYMAYKELGYKTIPAIVDPEAEMGDQDGQSWLIEDDKDSKDN